MTEHHAHIDDRTFAPIAALAEAAGKLHVPWFVIGAMGRVLLLERVYGLPHGRAAGDADFGLMVQNWGHFNNLVARLCVDTRFRRDSKLYRRLHFANGVRAPSL